MAGTAPQLPLGFTPVPTPCPPTFGAVVSVGASVDVLTDQLHRRGFLLFKGVHLTGAELVAFVAEKFPQLVPSGAYAGAKHQVEGQLVGALGNMKDEDGEFVHDFMPAGEGGAPLIGASAEQCDTSLKEWLHDNTEAAIMEWVLRTHASHLSHSLI